jgi:SsrA-binding protein
MTTPKRRSIARNRRARYDYEILERLEAGVVLQGSEVKALRAGRANLIDSHVRIERNEAWLVGTHIGPYENASIDPHEPRRKRKLLLNRREIRKLHHQTTAKGLTIVPLEIYFLGQNVKVEIGVVRGKRQHDKRESMKKRDAQRDMERARHDQ